jgi:phytol kinase
VKLIVNSEFDNSYFYVEVKSMLGNVWLALVATFALALSWLRLVDYFAHRGWLNGQLSRKIIHMGTGPIFVASWLLFPDESSARYLAALVPLAITIQFALVGLGFIKDPAAVNAMSRSGDRREILRGPLFYGIVFFALTIVYWRDTAIGIIALMLLCGGDGLADIIGKRFGVVHLPWSQQKSLAGSIAMFAGGWVFPVGIILLYLSAGEFGEVLSTYIPAVTIIEFVGAVVESFHFSDIDNFTVPLEAVILGHLLLP